jgi:steroid 5-alpha reductase family enzyme
MEAQPAPRTSPRRSKTGTWVAATLTSVVLGVLLALAGSWESAEVGDVPVFALAVTLAYVVNWIVFVPSFLRHTERFFDLTGSITYISITVFAVIASPDPDLRAWLAVSMVLVWAGRLGTFLFRRISRDGSDGRFDVIKHDFWQFLMTWTLQGLWVSLTAAAALVIITADDREPFGVAGAIGLAVWVAGFTIEVAADTQKSRFRADPTNAGRYITTGLWAWSRHPNYFGEITLWTGMAIMSIPVLTGWRWVALVSPIFVYVLLTRISGIPLQRRRAEKRWGSEPQFRAYMDSTPALLPRPPRRRS